MCAYNEFEEPKYFNQAPPLVYIGQIRVLLLLFSSRKFFPLYSDTWKYICHLCTMELHFSSLLNSHDDLLGSIWSILRYFDSLLTSKCGDHLMLSGQSQKLIELLGLLLKNFLRSFNMVINCSWYEWIVVLKIHLVAAIASVIAMMQLTSCKYVALLIPHLIVKSLALVELILVVW